MTGQFIEFVGFRNLTRHSVTGESLYSANSVYWLVSGRTAGKRAQSYDATPTGASTVAMHEAEGLFNRQRLHATGMTTIQAGHDYWFAGGLSAQGRAKDMSVPTPGVDGGGDAQIEIRLLGRTSGQPGPPHSTADRWTDHQRLHLRRLSAAHPYRQVLRSSADRRKYHDNRAGDRRHRRTV